MTDTKTLIPTEQLLELARQVAKKHRGETHPDFEDFVQDVLLGVLERQHEYDPACGTPKTFVLTIANQKACNRVVEQRRREQLIATNRNGCIPFRNAPENAYELDAKRFNYGNQLAFYQSVLALAVGQSVNVYIVAVEKKEPFRCGVWQIPEETLFQARAENEAAMERLREANRDDKFVTGYEELRYLFLN